MCVRARMHAHAQKRETVRVKERQREGDIERK